MLNFHPKPVIYGVQGTELTDDEKRFFEKSCPFGFILFARNIQSAKQIKALIADLQEFSAFTPTLVLIDQEGGRVQRIKPPIMPSYPPARAFGDLYCVSPDKARYATRWAGKCLGAHLRALGITVNCAPVCDVATPETHEVIGDRAFGESPAVVADLARAQAEGLIAAGVLPVIKHIPGHGRATADSHETLPRLNTLLADLQKADFVPFRALADLPLAMTAHILYEALDSQQPVTLSSRIIADIIREDIGFRGLLMSDDLSMRALRGSVEESAFCAISAGCDLALHCSGELSEMRAIDGVLSFMCEARLDFWRVHQKKLDIASESLRIREWQAEWAAIVRESPVLDA